MSTATVQNVWLDEHTGPVYTYAMVYRPAQAGFTCPKEGYLLVLESDPIRKHPRYPHGLIRYSRPLTPAEIETYQLAPI